MRKLSYRLLTLTMLLVSASFHVSAQGQLPVVAYVTIQGSHQGNFKGDGMTQGRQGMIECVGFSYGTQTPQDAASGLPTGRRQHTPVVIVKRLDAASPQLLEAAYTNEVLKSVSIEFVRMDMNGKQTTYQTIKLTNASVVRVNQYGGTAAPDKLIPNSGILEEVSFTFQKIEIDNTDGRTSAVDNWNVR